MTNYIPHYTKKKTALERNEAKLRRLVARAAPASKVIAMAETVRESRIRVLRARRATFPPTDGPQTLRIEKINLQIQTLEETSAQQILAEFGYNDSDHEDLSQGHLVD